MTGVRGLDGQTPYVPASSVPARTPPEGAPDKADGDVRASAGQGRPPEPSARAPDVAAEVAGGGIRTRFDETTDRFVSEIMDSNHEVIRQVPPEEVLKVIANVRRVQGLLFDEEA